MTLAIGQPTRPAPGDTFRDRPDGTWLPANPSLVDQHGMADVYVDTQHFGFSLYEVIEHSLGRGPCRFWTSPLRTPADISRIITATLRHSESTLLWPQDYTILYYTILYYTILYYTILYYTILYYTILYYTILYYTILYYTILYYTILYYTLLYSTLLYSTLLYFTILYYTILYYTILYYTTQYYTILYYTILYYTILYYTILYYTILYYTILYYTILYYTILYYTILYSTQTRGLTSYRGNYNPATYFLEPNIACKSHCETCWLRAYDRTTVQSLIPLRYYSLTYCTDGYGDRILLTPPRALGGCMYNRLRVQHGAYGLGIL